MTSENDGLMPTGMGESKNKVSPEFKETAQDSTQEASQDQSNEVVEVEVPDMIKEDNPHPQPRPDYDTSDVDAEHFDKKAQKDIEKYSQHKPKDILEKIDKESEWSKRLGRERGGRERD